MESLILICLVILKHIVLDILPQLHWIRKCLSLISKHSLVQHHLIILLLNPWLFNNLWLNVILDLQAALNLATLVII